MQPNPSTLRAVVAAAVFTSRTSLADPVGDALRRATPEPHPAHATFGGPRVLLLDEHLAALDPGTSAVVAELTGRIAAETGAAALMITHDLTRALELGTRTLVIRNGTIAADLDRTGTGCVSVDDLSALVLVHPGGPAPTDLLV